MTAPGALLPRLLVLLQRAGPALLDDLRRPAPAPRTPRRVLAAALLLGLAIAGLNQLGAPLRASHSARVTGDEPFYLLTTVSLLHDGDLDLTNDEAERRYRAFFDHPDELWRQSVPTPDGRLLSPHNAGLSLLVLPAYALGGLDGAKAFLGALGGWTAALMALLAYRATGHAAASLGAAALLGVSAPLFVYSTQVYPEAPAALIVTTCVWSLLGGRPGWRTALLLALGLNALVWLGVKYALVGGAVAALALVRQSPRGRWLLLALLAPGAAAYAAFHLAAYGALTPYGVNRVYAGAGTVELVGLHMELWNRLYRFAGLWVDGEFGLVRWTPALLLCLPALPGLLRSAGPVRWAAGLAVGVQLLVAVFFSITMRGWWFPGRMLIAVLPLLAVPLALTLAAALRRPLLAGAAALLSMYGVGVTLALRQAAAVEQVVLAVDPFALEWPPFRIVSGFFPVYTSYEAPTWLLTAAWTVGGVALTLPFLRKGCPSPNSGGGGDEDGGRNRRWLVSAMSSTPAKESVPVPPSPKVGRGTAFPAGRQGEGHVPAPEEQ